MNSMVDHRPDWGTGPRDLIQAVPTKTLYDAPETLGAAGAPEAP